MRIPIVFMLLLLCGRAECYAAFVETFNGTGAFSSSGVVLEGFDNRGWSYDGDGAFRDGGLWVENHPPPSEQEHRLSRMVAGLGDLSHVVEIRDLSLISDPEGLGASKVILKHSFQELKSTFSMTVGAIQNDPESYQISVGALAGAVRRVVEKSPHLRMEMFFDHALSQVSFAYDGNLDDDVPSVNLATVDYQGVVKQEALVSLSVGLFEAQEANALIDHWTFTSSEPPILPGDFNANGIFDAEDIDLLNSEIRSGSNNPDFDLVEDGIVDHFDRNFWVHTINNTFFGDANLNGEFNSGDLVAVFQAGQYEDGSMAGWAAGDWNGDTLFTSNDLVVAFQDGGYEVGPRQVANAVPEPSSGLLLLLSLLLISLNKTAPKRHQRHPI